MSEIPELRVTEGTQRKVTRRKFILGVIASGGVVAAANYRLISSAVHGQMSSAERLITINVNGMQRRVDVMKQETLAWTLRYKLGLTGTKLGCDRAECGACTVMIDDVPHYSCSVLTHTVRGRKVTTIRGSLLLTASCILCSRLLWMSRAFNAPSACRDSSCPLSDSSSKIPAPHAPNWRTVSLAICAAARTTTRFLTPWSAALST